MTNFDCPECSKDLTFLDKNLTNMMDNNKDFNLYSTF